MIAYNSWYSKAFIIFDRLFEIDGFLILKDEKNKDMDGYYAIVNTFLFDKYADSKSQKILDKIGSYDIYIKFDSKEIYQTFTNYLK